jgi:hypothetical protein
MELNYDAVERPKWSFNEKLTLFCQFALLLLNHINYMTGGALVPM